MRRECFAQYCRRELGNGAGYLERIVFSDECKFSLSESVNKQNCGIWGSECPNELYEMLQNTPSVMVCCDLSKWEIIRPIFFEDGYVRESRYRRMLRYFCIPSFETIQKARLSNRIVLPALCQRSKRIFGQEAYWTMDGKRWTDFMACALPRLDYPVTTVSGYT